MRSIEDLGRCNHSAVGLQDARFYYAFVNMLGKKNKQQRRGGEKRGGDGTDDILEQRLVFHKPGTS